MIEFDRLIVELQEAFGNKLTREEIVRIYHFIISDRQAILDKVCEPLKKIKDKWDNGIGENGDVNKEVIELSLIGRGNSLAQIAIQEFLNLAEEMKGLK